MVNLYVVIDNSSTVFPSTISPLYESAVINARTVEFKDTTTRIVNAELTGNDYGKDSVGIHFPVLTFRCGQPVCFD